MTPSHTLFESCSGNKPWEKRKSLFTCRNFNIYLYGCFLFIRLLLWNPFKAPKTFTL